MGWSAREVKGRPAELLRPLAGRNCGEKTDLRAGMNLGAAENTIKEPVQHICGELGVDNRNAATLRTLEALPQSS
jgi:hypothetical protein